MAEDSKIQWTDHTFNPWRGCTPVSPGCAHCYAAALSKRTGGPDYRKGEPRLRTKTWGDPVKWNKQAALHNATLLGEEVRPRVFCASLADWLDDEVPLEWLADLLALIHETPNLDWLLLTKRPENWRARIDRVLLETTGPIEFFEWLYAWAGQPGDRVMKPIAPAPPANVWIGTTVEDQTRAEQRIPALLSIPAKVRFLSCEPLLGPLDLQYPESVFPGGPNHCCSGHECGCMGLPVDPPLIWGVNWIITGGESGPKARPADLEWFRSLRDQCQAAGTAFFMKQLGGTKSHRGDLADFPEDLRIRQFPTAR